MICPLPIFDLPKEVEHALVEASNSSTSGSRNKRHASQQPGSNHDPSSLHSRLTNSLLHGRNRVTLDRLLSLSTDQRGNEGHLHRSRRKATASYAAGNSSVKLYIGFMLDNYPKYENISKALPNVTIKMTLQLPQISLNGERDYSEEPLPIKVSTLNTYRSVVVTN